MNPLCKIWGHKFDDKDIWNGPFHCSRCEHVFDPYNYYGEEHYESGSFDLGGKLWLLKIRINEKAASMKRYFQKCPDCGKRFNKHSPNCAPF